MKVFLHNGAPYCKIIPCKRLFNSTTVHEVVTRGSFFALNLLTDQFTVLPQNANKEKENTVCNQESFLQSTLSFGTEKNSANMKQRKKRTVISDQPKES